MATSLLWINNLLILSLGQITEINSPQGEIWLSQKKLLRIEENSHKIILSPLNLGNLYVHNLFGKKKLHKLAIVNKSQIKTIKKCRQWIHKINPVELKIPKFADFKRSTECGIQNPSLSKSDQSKYELQFKKKEKSILDNHYLGATINWQAGRRKISISSSTQQLKKHWLAGFKELAPYYDFVFLENSPKPGKNLFMHIALVEEGRKVALNSGVHWSEEILSSTAQGSSQSFVENIFLGTRQNHSKLLLFQKLRGQIGKEVTLKNGGEIPIVQTNKYYSSIDWKSYGLELKLKINDSVNTGAGALSASLNIKFSEPTPGLGPDSPPGSTFSEYNTEIDFREGRTIRLSDLSIERLYNKKKGLPLLSSLPLLGNAFSHKQREKQKSSLALFLRVDWSPR